MTVPQLPTEVSFVALAVLELGLLHYATRNGTVIFLKALILINMVLVALFAPKTLTMFGYTTNVTSICYSAVMVACLAIIEKAGRQSAREVIAQIPFAMAVFLAAALLIDTFPMSPEDHEYAAAIHILIGRTPQFLIVSFVSFVVAQTVLLELYLKLRERCPMGPAGVAALLVSQLVDSLIFFPVAFPDRWQSMLDMFLFGLVIKSGLGLLMFLAICNRVFKGTSEKCSMCPLHHACLRLGKFNDSVS